MADAQVFISYGRADGSSFAQRLASDLRGRGCQVWIDRSEIQPGEAFEMAIERAITQSSLIAAVMTRRSLSEDSVCRDEVVYAFTSRKRIVPLRIESDSGVKPSLLLARLNWIDFTDNYDTGLAALVALLDGNDSLLIPPQFPTVTGVAPLNFGIEIAKFTRDFYGREWLTPHVDRWLSAGATPALLILGEPGIGKSSIAGWLCQRPDVVAVHFCTQQNSRTVDASTFVASLVGQLCSQLPGYSAAVERLAPSAKRSSAVEAFRELILDPLHDLDVSRPRLIVVDSLDLAAASAGETIPDVLALHLSDFPEWLRIIATTRPEVAVFSGFQPAKHLTLDSSDANQLSDLQHFIHKEVLAIDIDQRDRMVLSSRLATEARGNFLFAKLAVSALKSGELGPQDLDSLAPGLSAFYRRLLSKLYDPLGEHDADYSRILSLLAVSRSALPLDLLAHAIGRSAADVNRLLVRLRPLLEVEEIEGAQAYSLFHKSLQDWLLNRAESFEYWCDPLPAHRMLAAVLQEEWEQSKHKAKWEHVWSSMAYHLYRGKDTKRMAEAISAEYLSQKVLRSGYAVLDDVEFLARALLEADDPESVQKCVALVDNIRDVVGGDVIRQARKSLQTGRGTAISHSGVHEVPIETRTALDAWAGLRPAGDVGADLCRVFDLHGRVLVLVGDAPGAGLKSVFSARFITNLVERICSAEAGLDPAETLERLQAFLGSHNYFEPLSLQLALIDLAEKLVAVASAGHPHPFHLSKSRRKALKVPVRGELLNAPQDGSGPSYRSRRFEIGPDDVLLFYTDGLTQQRAERVAALSSRLEACLNENLTARQLGIALLDEAKRPLDGEDFRDDQSAVVVRITQ